MTWDNPAGYNVDNYNQGLPTNYGPTDSYTTEREDPNGYGVTNLSHYDPNNFWQYFMSKKDFGPKKMITLYPFIMDHSVSYSC